MPLAPNGSLRQASMSLSCVDVFWGWLWHVISSSQGCLVGSLYLLGFYLTELWLEMSGLSRQQWSKKKKKPQAVDIPRAQFARPFLVTFFFYFQVTPAHQIMPQVPQYLQTMSWSDLSRHRDLKAMLDRNPVQMIPPASPGPTLSYRTKCHYPLEGADDKREYRNAP